MIVFAGIALSQIGMNGNIAAVAIRDRGAHVEQHETHPVHVRRYLLKHGHERRDAVLDRRNGCSAVARLFKYFYRGPAPHKYAVPACEFAPRFIGATTIASPARL